MNALDQDRYWMHRAVELARRGIAVAIAQELDLPVRYVGVGEQMADLLEFDPAAFIDSLLG